MSIKPTSAARKTNKATKSKMPNARNEYERTLRRVVPKLGPSPAEQSQLRTAAAAALSEHNDRSSDACPTMDTEPLFLPDPSDDEVDNKDWLRSRSTPPPALLTGSSPARGGVADDCAHLFDPSFLPTEAAADTVAALNSADEDSEEEVNQLLSLGYRPHSPKYAEDSDTEALRMSSDHTPPTTSPMFSPDVLTHSSFVTISQVFYELTWKLTTLPMSLSRVSWTNRIYAWRIPQVLAVFARKLTTLLLG
ncbi:hypothetical protein PLICRDRAFT_180862 [Plicaturopsis crispa FD-325 SS-3]|uniref:Uncharacterized protein n=1 Tax=Plicaturopsis crispa FD-325 SS-3 TaxID=944288 RepID=A0A0C9SK19_PLICR|nr:hypothetical protein PLICRDRAFT_180862 [Plicaturopsis crispa FD-325 SS-3]